MKLTRESIPGGRLWLAVSGPEAEAVRLFVLSGASKANARVLHQSSRCTVRLAEVPGAGRCILKEAGVIRGPAPFNRFAAVKRIARHCVSGLEFRHDFPLEGTLAEGYGEAAAKYARRTARLLAALEKAERPLAVFCDGYGCPPVPLAELEQARAILAARFGDKVEVLGIFDDRPGEAHEAAEAVSADGKSVRWSLPCEKRAPDGIEVSAGVVSRFLAARISCPDPHTPAERRRAERLAVYDKYKARTWLGMIRNKMLFRRYRRLGKILQKKGIIPANRPGLH